MKRVYRNLLAICLTLLLCSPALAQHVGPYIGGYAGGSMLMPAKGTDNLGTFNLTYKPALQWGAVAGWDFRPDTPIGEGRIELEYSHRSNPLDQVKFAGGNFPGAGNVAADSLLMNFIGMYRDRGRWAPYLLLGAGAARIEASGLKVAGQPLASGTATVFAYQVGTGIDLALTDRFSFDIGYRFFGSLKPQFSEADGRTFDLDYFSHSALLGLRLGF